MDSDNFDDIFSNNAVKNARAGSKFQPKAKPRPLKRNSTAPLVPSSQQVRTAGLSASEFTESCEAKNASEPGLSASEFTESCEAKNVSEPGLSASDFTESCEAKNASEPDDQRSSGIVNASLGLAATTENVDSVVDLGPSVNIFIPDSSEDWPSCFQKSVGETSDIFIELDSLGDFLPDSSAVLDNTVPSSEAPAAYVPTSSNTEETLANPLVPAIDGSACFSNVPSISPQPEISAAQDPLTGSEAIITKNDSGCPTDNRELETEELESYPCLETLEMSDLTNGYGRRIRKFQPKPKLQAGRSQSNISDVNHVDSVSTVPSQQDLQSVPPENNFMDQGSVPTFTQNVSDFSAVELSGPAAESASQVVTDAEQISPKEPSHPGAGIPVEHLKVMPDQPGKLASRRAKARKSTAVASDLSPKQCTFNQVEIAGRSLRKRQNNKKLFQVRDNSEEEAVADGDLHSESPSISSANGNSKGDEEFQPENESQANEVQKKSKRNSSDKEKPVRKRKKDNETSEQAGTAAPKKFSHSTRRRRVNKTLLETPEDEIDFQKVPLRDLILLAEHKERNEKKDATASQTPLPNQSAGNDNEDRGGDAFQQYYQGEPFAPEHGGEGNDEEPTPAVEESSGYFNYQTYMDKTPVVRWSKQDTELFYEAVRQFGSDLSLIQQLFPGRTRRQVKLKYKKEERQHPLRLRDALTNRSKDHSHFELVIDRLRQLAAEEKKNSNKADSVDLTGEEEIEEETPETNEYEGKSEQINEETMYETEQDFTQVQSPVKTYDSEDDLFHWSQYKSEE